MSTLGNTTNYDYRGLGDEPESQALSEAESGTRPPQPLPVITTILRRSHRLNPPAAPDSYPIAIRPQQPVSLDASPAKDDNGGGGVQSRDFVSGEPATMAPRGGDESDRDDGAYDAHQQPDPPSKRRRLEELGEYHRRKRQKIRRSRRLKRRHEKTRKRLRTGERNASETTAPPEVEDSGRNQDPRDKPESQLPSEAESRDQPHHQPQQTGPTSLPSKESSTVHVSNHQLPQATEDTRGGDGTPVPGAGDAELPIDSALFNDQQACNDDDEGENGNNTSLCGDKDRQSPPPAPDSSIAFREASLQPSHREAEHDMQWDQGDAEPANQTPSEAGSRGYSPPAAISSRGLLTPAATLDVNPAEDSGNDNGGNDGYNSPASTLQMGGSIAQSGAMPASDVRDADPPEDHEDGNLYEALVSSETAVDPRGEPESEVLSEAEAEPQAHH
ncbi:hypothetical protein FALCPG4_003089 [Fusarium falciforme]